MEREICFITHCVTIAYYSDILTSGFMNDQKYLGMSNNYFPVLSDVVYWVGGRTLAELMCVFLCAASCPLEKEEKEAQLIETQVELFALLFQDR